jgi:pimeloyl-ACP methyl ester carboxylesterase
MSTLPAGDGDVAARIARFPLRTAAAGGRVLAYREAGAGPALVLLHGIGNQSGSWVQQLEAQGDKLMQISNFSRRRLMA